MFGLFTLGHTVVESWAIATCYDLLGQRLFNQRKEYEVVSM
jgi:hypothetical protein